MLPSRWRPRAAREAGGRCSPVALATTVGAVVVRWESLRQRRPQIRAPVGLEIIDVYSVRGDM